MICNTRKILFIHIPKTGGTTVEWMIRPAHADSDEPDYSTLRGWDEKYGWLDHLTRQQVNELYSYDELRDYLVFTVVRNPWDRLVSEFHWKRATSGLRLPFHEYVRRLHGGEVEELQKHYKAPTAFRQHMRSQASYCFDGEGGPGMRILRYESFEHDVVGLLRTVGIRSKTLPRLRASVHEGYTSYYDKCTMEMVEELYHDDIEAFGYEYRSGMRREIGLDGKRRHGHY